MKIHKITYPDVENGIGFRITIWVSGCTHKCKGCHNPETWDKESGRDFTDEDKEKIFAILSKPYIKGVTFSGGDPLCFYLEDVYSLAKEIKEKFPKKDIWLYTGFKKSEILQNEKRRKITEVVDYIVDGEYHEYERDTSLEFRGSRNQCVYQIIRDEIKNGECFCTFKNVYKLK